MKRVTVRTFVMSLPDNLQGNVLLPHHWSAGSMKRNSLSYLDQFLSARHTLNEIFRRKQLQS